jgi:hypothetical protein
MPIALSELPPDFYKNKIKIKLHGQSITVYSNLPFLIEARKPHVFEIKLYSFLQFNSVKTIVVHCHKLSTISQIWYASIAAMSFPRSCTFNNFQAIAQMTKNTYVMLSHTHDALGEIFQNIKNVQNSLV